MKRETTARTLRRTQTSHERQLWRALRAKQMADEHFRRQHPIGPFIVDFVCLQRRLVIELDGSQHAGRSIYDAQRTDYLNERGFRVLRFWNRALDENFAGVLSVIWEALSK